MTFWFCRFGTARLVGLVGVIASLGACAPTPFTLVSAVDLVLTATEDDTPVQTGPISIDQLLANARDADAGNRDPAQPTATLERAPEGMDGPAYVALGTFLSDLDPSTTHTVVVTRSEPETTDIFSDAQFAVLVGQLIERAGHKVELAVSAAQSNGSLHLTIREEASA